MISVEELVKIRDFVLKQVTKNNQCLVLGTEEMIDSFCHDTNTKIDYIMTDSLNIDNELESAPAKMYNPKSKEVFLLSLTDKDYLIHIIRRSREIDGTGIKEDLRYLLGIQLVRKKYRDGYMNSADVICADSEEEKIGMINKFFRRPPEKVINEMKKLSQDISIIEVDKKFDRLIKQNPKVQEFYANERLCESLGISDDRFEELRQILLKLSKLSIHSGSMNDIMEIDHEKYIDLLEKEKEEGDEGEKGISHRERLYLAFSLGGILQQLATQFNEKFSSLENDRDERIKSIGKRYACEVMKSITLSKIDNLKLNLREKLKANFWAGWNNQKFYCKEEKELT
jgi:hypothetical protein